MTDDLRTQLERTLSGSYALERELGGGGMSRVFVAEETALGRKVVVKVLPPNLAATVNVERFRREIRLAAQLQHPHIVPLLAAGIVDGLPYYTMPLIEGETLRERLRKQGELPVGDALRILRDIASALSYAHEHGVVHRDIKPENVLVTRHHALVADFGVAKALSASTNPGSSLTSLGVALGTPAYMAPEQAAADPATDHRADIYAVGALAYELLTGRQVFGDRSPQAMLRAHAVEQPEAIETHRPSVPPAVAAFVLKLLEKHPADRPQTADEVLLALESFVATPSGGMTPTSMPPTQRTPAVAHRVRRSWPLVGAALVGAGLLAAAGMMARSRLAGRALDPSRIVLPAFENRTGDQTFDELGVFAADWLTRALTQSGIAEVAMIDSVSGELGARATSLKVEELRALARTAGAGHLVRGSVGRRGDSLEFGVSILDVKGGRTLSTVRPVIASVSEPMAGIEQVRQQAMGALTTLLSRHATSSLASVAPPSYEAYMEFMRGEAEFERGRFDAALEHYERSAKLDTTYVAPVIVAAYAHINAGRCAQTDSIAQSLQSGRYRVSEYERHYMARVVAWCQRDWNEAYRAARSLLGAAPTSVFAQYIAARSAIFINRLDEARAGLEQLWPNKFQKPGFYADLSTVYHVLGDHRGERRVVRAARTAFPDLALLLRLEGRLAAAIGDSGTVDRVLREMRSRHRPPEYDAADDMRAIAAELATHGRAVHAQALFEDLYQFSRRRPARETETPGFRRRLAETMAITRRCSEATAAIDRASRMDTSLQTISTLGRIAAYCGDISRADSIATRLADWEEPYLGGRNTVNRAAIAAILGRKRESVDLLLDAIAEGILYSDHLHESPAFDHFHTSPAFATLRDYPPFKALLAPRN